MSVLVTGQAETPLPLEFARMVSALLDWTDHEEIDLRLLCETCYKLGHPQPFVRPDVEAGNVFVLTCPHRKLVYRGPDPRMPAH